MKRDHEVAGPYTPVVYALNSWYRFDVWGHWARVNQDEWTHFGER
jgi:hypothetical protein